MRRFIAYAALLAIVCTAGGCAFTDYPGGAQRRQVALEDMNLSHQGITCSAYDKVPGLNTQQNWEKALINFDRVAPPGPPGSFCNVTKIGQVSAEEAKEWMRFIGPWFAYNEATASGYGGCLDGFWALSGIKGLEDGSVRLTNFRWQIPAGTGWTCPWVSTATVASENIVMADEVGGYHVPSVYNTKAYTGLWVVAIDKDPVNYGYGNNIVAFNHDETNPAQRCDTCMSTLWAMSIRAYEGQLTNAAMKGSAGLAEFFNGDPMTIEHRGWKYTISGQLNGDWVLVKIHQLDNGSAVYTAQKPIEVMVDAKTHRRFQFNWDGQKEEVARLAEWVLANNDLSKQFTIGGFIPELGITIPERSFTLIESSMRNFVVNATSGIQPRQREGIR